ncbi:V-type ATPase, G subunit [Fonsecaea monophora]|uniref:V-type proton ATPase subunit G n=1 Tax=Fonsecaea monophora TaxID=254056 RepID=A0A177EY19_9EURO|nr:V-type ATPase, G subunit [Fonsecaea monophora]OAG36848.1 V-type ATPase, G subunit [Fonsecaea monophora]
MVRICPSNGVTFMLMPIQSAQNSAGIQTLLDAEKEAQKIVQKENVSFDSSPLSSVYRISLTRPFSSPDRTKRVKDAKTEAQKEIEEYRKKKEEEFKKFEAEQSSGNKKAEDDASKDAEAKVKEIDQAGKKAGAKVIEDLIKTVMSPHPEVPDKISRED